MEIIKWIGYVIPIILFGIICKRIYDSNKIYDSYKIIDEIISNDRERELKKNNKWCNSII